jgi:hypothetical protein
LTIATASPESQTLVPLPSSEGSRITSVVTPAPRRVWRELAQSDPDALPYQSPEWTDSACATGRFVDVSRLYETADGRQFVLPLLVPAGLPSALAIAASMPSSWGIGGPIGSAPINPKVLGSILNDLRAAGFLSVRIRPNPLHSAIWSSVSMGQSIARRAHVLNLDGGFQTVWEKRFSSRLRGVIRKAERGVEVEFDTTGRLLPQFYALLEKSFLRWAKMYHEPRLVALWRGRRRDPYARFEAMSAAMGEACQVGLASIEGVPVASIIVLRGLNANYSRGAMDAERVGNSGANELLHKLAIEDAARSGCNHYHMGESGRSSSLSRFKEKFGAVAHDYNERCIERLPLAQIDRTARSAVKRLIGFKDAD